jgi:hypothetical protein
MNDYKSVFRELQYEVWKVAFLNAFLNGALTFFIGNIICTIIHERYIFSVIPAVIVFLWSFIRTVRKYTLRRIEEGNPEVAEILRTAHDNKGGDNLMVHALFLELMQKMETVSAGVFLSSTKLVGSLILIAVLAPMPLVMTNYCPTACTVDGINGVSSIGAALVSDSSPLAPILPADDAGDRDIYGDQDVMRLGNDKLDIAAASGSGGVDFTKTDDASGKQFTYNDYPGQVEAEQTTAGTGGKEAEATLINSYSNKTRSRS